MEYHVVLELYRIPSENRARTRYVSRCSVTCEPEFDSLQINYMGGTKIAYIDLLNPVPVTWLPLRMCSTKKGVSEREIQRCITAPSLHSLQKKFASSYSADHRLSI